MTGICRTKRPFRSGNAHSGQGRGTPHILLDMAESTDSDVPTLDALARRYLDLWQEQWAALAADPAVAENLARMFQMMGQGAASLAPFVYGGTPGTGWDPRPPPNPAASSASSATGPAHDHSRHHETSATPGAAPAGPAPVDGDGDPAQLRRRIAALEERLAALEAPSRGAGGRAAKAPRRGRSGRAGQGG
jgi:hypothetical protein